MAHQAQLTGIGIPELVYQECPHLGLPIMPHFRLGFQKMESQSFQVIKVEGLTFGFDALIMPVCGRVQPSP